MNTCVDHKGSPVYPGATVRVLSVASSILEPLSPEERRRVKSMEGETFQVYDIDPWGCAWIEKWWGEGEAEAESHSLALTSSEMEVVPQ